MELSQKEFEETYLIGEFLGEGSFGSVNVATCKNDGRKYAVKSIFLPQDEINKKKLFRESDMMSKLSHTNIIECFNYATVKENIRGKHETQGCNIRYIQKCRNTIDIL